MNPSSAIKQWNNLICETDAVYHDISRIYGLTDSSSIILYSLYIQGGSALLNDIYKQSGTSKQTINSALRKLEADAIVSTEVFCGKKKLVSLTEQGNALAEHTVAHTIAIENEILSSWKKEEVELLLSLSQRYLTELKEKVKTLPERTTHENSII